MPEDMRCALCLLPVGEYVVHGQPRFGGAWLRRGNKTYHMRCIWLDTTEKRDPRMARIARDIKPTIHDDSIPSWRHIRNYYQPITPLGKGLYVGKNYLAWRTRCGVVCSVLQLDLNRGYPTFMIHVAPAHRRRGVASKLIYEAMFRWPNYNPFLDKYTESGAWCMQDYLLNHGPPELWPREEKAAT